MSTMSAADARSHLSEVLDLAAKEPVFIERRGACAGVVISPERYEQMLEALEEVEDTESLDAAMAEEGPNIPWGRVKADLGLG